MDKENGKEKHILTKPDGELVIRTIAMPRDTNPTGDIFGGWLLSQMDIGGLIAATEIAKGRTTTVAINAMRFWNPVHVGDIICIHAALKRVGRTSITFLIEPIIISRSVYGKNSFFFFVRSQLSELSKTTTSPNLAAS